VLTNFSVSLAHLAIQNNTKQCDTRTYNAPYVACSTIRSHAPVRCCVV